MSDLVEQLRAEHQRCLKIIGGTRASELCVEAAARIRALEDDAARYRWLRDTELSPWAAVRAKGAKTPADIDAAIDAARALLEPK